jgi:hypothetical protein
VLTALSEACELEHGIACTYLYAAFTIKDSPATEDLTWQQLQLTRRWKGQIYFIAAQEMLHLAQVWNLLTALGGTPYYARPNFPQSSKYYPIKAKLTLERFGENALKRFIFYERPFDASPDRDYSREMGFDAPPEFVTIGDLYDQIAVALGTLNDGTLFAGTPATQANSVLVDFPDLVPVTDLPSALRAIATITDQGEGTATDRQDCHFGMYRRILDELKGERDGSPRFDPARPSIDNPRVRLDPDYGAAGGNLIDGAAALLCDVFDDLYVLMLRMLAYAFSAVGESPQSARSFAQAAIRMMPVALKPLGELLTTLPAHHAEPHGKTAGPSFGLTRHVQLPLSARAAKTVVKERLSELAQTLEDFGTTDQVGGITTRVAASIRSLNDVIA